MAFPIPRATFCWVSSFRSSSLAHSHLLPIPHCLSSLTHSRTPMRAFETLASLSNTTAHNPSSPPTVPSHSHKVSKNRWKPMCLYYTQGKCTKLRTSIPQSKSILHKDTIALETDNGSTFVITCCVPKMDDAIHLEKFNHDCSRDLEVNIAELKHICSQNLDFFLVLDLEGRVEILEFPVLMINAKTMDVMDFFHRFVRPSEMSEQRINEYIEGKYGKFGVDRVWHDTAIPFTEVLHQFEVWLAQHHLWEKELGGRLNEAAFVTCGNWDLKTKVFQQCKVSKMKLPPYFMEWINLKDVYLNFYKRRAAGMMTMMKELRIPVVGSHHLGIDDTKNIARVLQHMLADGALIQITARRNSDSPENIEFLFKNRIR